MCALRLAYEGLIDNRIVFTQDELPSTLTNSSLSKAATPTPAQQDLPAMGVLQRVQWAGTSSKTISYNFVHLSFQEMLAAYRISQMGSYRQVKVFKTLLDNPRFVTVLQFYAGFTELANRGVCRIMKGSDFTNEKASKLSLLSYMRCFYEAQICDESLFKKMTRRLKGNLYLFEITLSPLDCMSVGYFLAFVLKKTTELRINLKYCGIINDHSFGLMMGELSKQHTGAKEVTALDITGNEISDSCIASALQSSMMVRTLYVGGITVTDEGTLSLAATLADNSSIEHLRLFWSSANPNNMKKKILGEYVGKSRLRDLELALSMPSTEDPKLIHHDWSLRVTVGRKDLVQSLGDSHQLEFLRLEEYVYNYGSVWSSTIKVSK